MVREELISNLDGESKEGYPGKVWSIHRWKPCIHCKPPYIVLLRRVGSNSQHKGGGTHRFQGRRMEKAELGVRDGLGDNVIMPPGTFTNDILSVSKSTNAIGVRRYVRQRRDVSLLVLCSIL
jgi:hypothetical protein